MYIVVKGKIMNLGTPPVTFAPEAAVAFRESPVPFDQIIMDWLRDNPKYQEVSRDRTLRLVTFKNPGNRDTGTSPCPELLQAVAGNRLKCPKCGRQVRTAENYKAKFTDKILAGGQPSRQFLGEEVTLICYKCGAETRVDNWRDFLAT
jgi:hypothetical protein